MALLNKTNEIVHGSWGIVAANDMQIDTFTNEGTFILPAFHQPSHIRKGEPSKGRSETIAVNIADESYFGILGAREIRSYVRRIRI